MHARLFDVLHHTADDDALAVAQAVHVDLNGVVQEAVKQHRGVVADLDGLAHVTLQVALVMDDFHGAATQHVAGAHHQRVADLVGQVDGLALGTRRAVGRLQQAQAGQQLLEALAVLGDVDGIGRGTDDGHAGRFQRAGELQRGLATVLDDDADRFFQLDDLQHVFQRDGFEVQAIGGVVVGGDGLGVAVDHDGLEPVFTQRERRMHAAVVELDALPDAVRATAQHDDLLAIGGLCLALVLVGGVQVRSLGGELGRAGVHPLIDRPHTQAVTQLADLVLGGFQQVAQPAVGVALFLQRAQRLGIQVAQRHGVELQLDVDDLLHLREEPRVDLRERMDFLDGEALGEGIAHVPDTLGTGLAQLLLDDLAVGCHLVEAVDADLQATHGLLQRLLEGATDGHDLAHRLHLGREAVVGLRELLEGKARNLDDHVVDGGLERRRGGTPGDLVLQLVQRVAHGQLGRHLGNGEARGLGGQCRGARDARVHLDDDHPPGFGMDGELDVGAARVDADFAQHRDRGVAHQLVFLVGQRLRWRHGDGVAGVHAHRIQVLDGADDDAVVLAVTHHLHLELFPADEAFLDQQLVGGREFQTGLADGLEFLGVVGNAAAGAPQREAGTDDDGETDVALCLPGIVHGMGDG